MAAGEAGTGHDEHCLTNGGQSLGHVLFGGRRSRIGTRSAASPGSVEPSNSDTPTAPTGAIPDMMLRYFCRNFIRSSIMEQHHRRLL